MPDVFISYSREDQATARRFAEALEREGFSVWWDQTLSPGDAYDHVTEKALKEAKAVAVLWSRNSVDSRWVRAEATQANRNHTLVPVMIERCERPIMFELTHTMDLSHWNGDPKDKEWQAYVTGLRRFVQKDAPAAAPASTAQTISRRSGNIRPIAITIAVATLVVAGIAWWATHRAPDSPAKQPAPIASTTPAATSEVTLAVLPFADLSPAHDQEYFSDGMSEEILNQVAQIEGLRVTARTSSFAFKGKTGDMRAIGEKLGVANLLEGSIRKDGNDLRITAQLINASDGTHIWSNTYAREMKKILEVQDEIARDVARQLSVKLDVGASSRREGGTTNLEAYDKYLRAIAAGSKGDFKLARKYVGQATGVDPDFLNAWMLDFAYLGFVGLHKDDSAQEQSKIVKRIEAIAPGSWQALFVRASSESFNEKWLEAKTDYEAAYAVAAKGKTKVGIPTIGAYDAQRRRQMGDISGAQKIWEPLIEASPSVFYLSQWLQVHLFDLGRNAEGLAELDRYKVLTDYPGGSEIDLLMELRFRKSVGADTLWAQYSTMVKKDPLLQSLYSRRNDAKAARQALHQAFDAAADKQRAPSERIAFWADYFGDKDLALSAIERGLAKVKKDFFPLTSLWYPYATGLRSDSRFKEIVREQGLVDYWRRSGEWGDFCKPVGTEDFECH